MRFLPGPTRQEIQTCFCRLIHDLSSDRNEALFCDCAEFNFKISSTFWDCNNRLRGIKRVDVSQAFAVISVKPLCLQWQEPLMINVGPLDNFSEQRISRPLARAQQRENKVKEGVYCQGYLNKWLKGVDSVAVWHTVWSWITLTPSKQEKQKAYIKRQAPQLTSNLCLVDTILLFGNEWHDFTVYASPQIPRDVKSTSSTFLFWICLEANSRFG